MIFKKGFHECSLTSFDQFIELLKKGNNFKGYIFRGQNRKSHKLSPGFMRELKSNDDYERLLVTHLKKYKNAIRGRINLSQLELENELPDVRGTIKG